jgi:hypothetical protein
VASTRGGIASFDAGTLRPLTTDRLAGRGPSTLAVGDGSVWLLNGIVDLPTLILHRLDPDTGAEASSWDVPGDGVGGSVTIGERLWIATQDDAGGLLYSVSPKGRVGDRIPGQPVVALDVGGGAVWTLSGGGEIVRMSETTLARSRPFRIGDAGSDLDVSGGWVWAASNELVSFPAGP